MDIKKESNLVGSLAFKWEHAKRTVETETKEQKKAELHLKHTQDAQEILQLLAEAVQNQVHQRISKVVTSCLKSVFGEDCYDFEIQFDRKRGRTEAALRFVRGDLDVDPLSASGGGVVDVASFALRVACLVLHRPRLSRVVVLDEPFKFVSAQYRENVRTMLEQLSRDMEMQIILVTHIEELETGKVIEI